MKQFGLIGYPLSHSFSPTYFAQKFKTLGVEDCVYEAFPIASIHDLPQLLDEYPNMVGFNITIPYKKAVMYYLDNLSDEAQTVDAVNTVRIEYLPYGRRRLHGYNTDVIGFEQSLLPLLQAQHRQRALVLGTGGAAQAVLYVLNLLAIPYKVVSRNTSAKALSYEDLASNYNLADFPLIINTTPLGMSPNYETKPTINYDQLSDKHLLYDLVYNPEETAFLTEGRQRGASIKNGLEMLHLQADAAWKIWNG